VKGYGWIGFGAPELKPDGFPGYTEKGWMLCTDGKQIYHNKMRISVSNL